jgi:hypothetical protein
MYLFSKTELCTSQTGHQIWSGAHEDMLRAEKPKPLSLYGPGFETAVAGRLGDQEAAAGKPMAKAFRPETL